MSKAVFEVELLDSLITKYKELLGKEQVEEKNHIRTPENNQQQQQKKKIITSDAVLTFSYLLLTLLTYMESKG